MAVILALLAGVFTVVESSINSQLGKQITPSIATLHSLATGAVFMLIISLVRGSSSRYIQVFSISPVWLIGGFFGAMIIYLSSRAIPVLGVSKALTLILTAQIITGLLIDLFFEGVRIDFYKVFGVLFLLLGANLVIR
ncbi:MAG: DMT family transporter [Oscillospiraceae bacterium]|nr:DMT family transporter [Oscillospiraceae bacterium]